MENTFWPSLSLYGCNLASGDAGTEFLARLHQITGLSVAASRTKTGNSVGGDWQLEVTVGLQKKKPQPALTQAAQSAYAGILANVQIVKDIKLGAESSSPGYFTEFNGKLLFRANDGTSGGGLWVSDGTTEGTQLVKNIRPSVYSSNDIADFIEFNSQLFFSADDGTTGRELWVSDGTTEGTQLVKDINPNPIYPGTDSSPNDFVESNGKLFFKADDGTTGEELWISDGTTEGTQLVKDINPDVSTFYYYPQGVGSYPEPLIEVAGKLFFTADDGTNGRELWVSDGTTEGTQLFKDLNPGIGAGSFSYGFVEFAGKLFFSADDGTNGRELWVSDGTTEGTQLVKDINLRGGNSFGYGLIKFAGKLFFSADDGTTGEELWVSDGTTEGTQLFKDLNPGIGAGSSPYSFVEVDGKLFFTAFDGTTGRELWVSDGTPEGTHLVKDIYSGSFSSVDGIRFVEFDGKLFFSARDGMTGVELWVSDGTPEGTQLVKDINVDPIGGDIAESFPDKFIEVDGKLLFTAFSNEALGEELWITDGTSEGTALFQDFNPGFYESELGSFKVLNNQLLFTASDRTSGREVWSATIPEKIISGDDNNNVLNGTAQDDLISGFDGNDVVRGRAGKDLIYGGNDDDILFGDLGSDFLEGDAGNDQLFGDRGNDTLKGGAGNDTLQGGIGTDTVIVNDFTGVGYFDGGTGRDLLRFSPIDNRDLTIFLGRGAVGDRRIGGQFFVNFEQIMTGNGNDRLLGDEKANHLDGAAGNDELYGGTGKDTLIGSVGNDKIWGGQGADMLLGSTEDDEIRGGQGADTLVGGTGNDLLVGEEGVDTFQFESDLLDGTQDTDTIENFQAQDSFDFSNYLSTGASITFTRVSPNLLQIVLQNEDVVNVSGTSVGLNAAEVQLVAILG